MDQALQEISEQATENNRYRGELLDMEALQASYQVPADVWRCLDELPDDLWIRMLERGLDPDAHEDRMVMAKVIKREGHKVMRRLN